MTADFALVLADLILAVHFAIVVFVVGGLLSIVAGGILGWAWVRHRGFRVTHLALIVFIVAQTWLGELCPLTVWEQDLRVFAGQEGYRESFIEHWLSRLLYFDAPWWVFVTAYTVFGALVVGSWWWIPPRRGRRPALQHGHDPKP